MDDLPPGRLFFALWPDAPLGEAVHALAGQWQRVCGGRIMLSATLHMTLAFLGDAARSDLAAACSAADAVYGRRCRLTLGRAGWWAEQQIAWLAPARTPPRLSALVGGLRSGLLRAGVAFDRRRWFAHVTMLRNAACPPRLAVTGGLHWPVSEFVLVHSSRENGLPAYRVVGRWPLA